MHNRIAGLVAGVREREKPRFRAFKLKGRFFVMDDWNFLSDEYDTLEDARAAAAEWELLRSLGLPTPRLGGGGG